MTRDDYLRTLVEDIHSAAVATLDADGRPQTRVIDMMLWDERGVYFLTARGKAFYDQLMAQKSIALSATKDKISISLRGRVQSIGAERLDEIFEKNPYMQSIYPGNTRGALEVFRLYEAEGEFFDIRVPSHVVRDHFVLGAAPHAVSGYFVGEECIGCGRCDAACPQKCIDASRVPAVIEQNRCLHCGRCAEVCPRQAIQRRTASDSPAL